MGGTDTARPGLGLEIRVEIVRKFEECICSAGIDLDTGEEVFRLRAAEGFRISCGSGCVIIEGVARVHILGKLG